LNEEQAPKICYSISHGYIIGIANTSPSLSPPPTKGVGMYEVLFPLVGVRMHEVSLRHLPRVRVGDMQAY
jgi:hypothetical protein